MTVPDASTNGNGNGNGNPNAVPGPVASSASSTAVAATANKPKRVRTGCLTCRERHLKCDEGLPTCQNCRKSNRVCKRGLRLNFIDTQVQEPQVWAPSQEWRVEFLDESREIASEYVGGAERYGGNTTSIGSAGQRAGRRSAAHINSTLHTQGLPAQVQQSQHHLHHHSQQQQQQHQQQQTQHQHQQDLSQVAYEYPAPAAPAAPPLAYQPLPSIQGVLPEQYAGPDEQAQSMKYEAPPTAAYDPQQYQQSSHSAQESPYSTQNLGRNSVSGYSHQDVDPDITEERREFLTTADETLFMQVFVEEVGLWMDSMDSMKHFSRLLPFHSLQEPMLLNAFLACGARHLTLVNPAYGEEKALHYYDTATRHLLKNLQNPNRDTVICATTAVILNVYEIMSERALQRMNHIAGARALIKECGWNARASGIGAACFWLNVGLEVLSCLHFNWQVAWDPDDWGIDMDFAREVHNGREEIWTHRMLYIVAKVANFRATIPRYTESDPRDEELRRQNRCVEWDKLKSWAEAWNEAIPRTMHPMAYLYPQQTASKSCFPEVWLVKRTTIVARLFYHTVMVLLAQIHPFYGPEVPPMSDMQSQHSRLICGIVAHVKDRGVASVAIRSLAHAADCLTDRREQEEVIEIFKKINKETGWRINFVFKELKEKWGWQDEPTPVQSAHSMSSISSGIAQQQQQQSVLQSAAPLQPQQQQQPYAYQTPIQSVAPPVQAAAAAATATASRRPPSGIVNPMFANADFTLPSHPYEKYGYVAPNNAMSSASTLYY